MRCKGAHTWLKAIAGAITAGLCVSLAGEATPRNAMSFARGRTGARSGCPSCDIGATPALHSRPWNGGFFRCALICQSGRNPCCKRSRTGTDFCTSIDALVGHDLGSG
ncbi:MAG: hypothetical protein JWO80_2919 [Bryobacterales bacterium]|nr:hypothetical protein [Bryobacterales bacterium]